MDDQKQPPDPVPDDPVPNERPSVPVEEWIQHPVSDSAEYLDRVPVYGDEGLTDEQKVEYEAALREREKRAAGHGARPRREK